MNREVHYDFTRLWALEAGFSDEDAETIARPTGTWIAIHDVHVVAQQGLSLRLARRQPSGQALLDRARRGRRPRRARRGPALIQDADRPRLLGHVVHWDGIDRWERRGAARQASDRARSRVDARQTASLVEGGVG